ncbi:MAG: enoyl-CoA hydratase/isomerase family protein [Sinobacteraceae bacterium]|nr:enoyl-CoA hydratase/isomerase family protein [Nevskiaceae bacterium]
MVSSRSSSAASADALAPLDALRDWARAAAAAAQAHPEPLLARIERTPIASTVLMHALRAAEALSLESALVLESLAYSTLQAGPEFRAWRATRRTPSPPQARDQGPAVILERRADALCLTLNRASLRNTMSLEMRDALIEALELALADDTIARVEIRARGKCFSVGGELTEFGTAPDPATAHVVRTQALPGRLLARCARRASVYVHGACIGSGIEFPAFAGRVIAASDAWFQLPELNYGLIPGAGGTVSIARRIGALRTAYLVLSGKRLDVRTALAWGLVDAIEPDSPTRTKRARSARLNLPAP